MARTSWTWWQTGHLIVPVVATICIISTSIITIIHDSKVVKNRGWRITPLRHLKQSVWWLHGRNFGFLSSPSNCILQTPQTSKSSSITLSTGILRFRLTTTWIECIALKLKTIVNELKRKERKTFCAHLRRCRRTTVVPIITIERLNQGTLASTTKKLDQ